MKTVNELLATVRQLDDISRPFRSAQDSTEEERRPALTFEEYRRAMAENQTVRSHNYTYITPSLAYLAGLKRAPSPETILMQEMRADLDGAMDDGFLDQRTLQTGLNLARLRHRQARLHPDEISGRERLAQEEAHLRAGLKKSVTEDLQRLGRMRGQNPLDAVTAYSRSADRISNLYTEAYADRIARIHEGHRVGLIRDQIRSLVKNTAFTIDLPEPPEATPVNPTRILSILTSLVGRNAEAIVDEKSLTPSVERALANPEGQAAAGRLITSVSAHAAKSAENWIADQNTWSPGEEPLYFSADRRLNTTVIAPDRHAVRMTLDFTSVYETQLDETGQVIAAPVQRQHSWSFETIKPLSQLEALANSANDTFVSETIGDALSLKIAASLASQTPLAYNSASEETLRHLASKLELGWKALDLATSTIHADGTSSWSIANFYDWPKHLKALESNTTGQTVALLKRPDATRYNLVPQRIGDEPTIIQAEDRPAIRPDDIARLGAIVLKPGTGIFDGLRLDASADPRDQARLFDRYMANEILAYGLDYLEQFKHFVKAPIVVSGADASLGHILSEWLKAGAAHYENPKTMSLAEWVVAQIDSHNLSREIADSMNFRDFHRLDPITKIIARPNVIILSDEITEPRILDEKKRELALPATLAHLPEGEITPALKTMAKQSPTLTAYLEQSSGRPVVAPTRNLAHAVRQAAEELYLQEQYQYLNQHLAQSREDGRPRTGKLTLIDGSGLLEGIDLAGYPANERAKFLKEELSDRLGDPGYRALLLDAADRKIVHDDPVIVSEITKLATATAMDHAFNRPAPFPLSESRQTTSFITDPRESHDATIPVDPTALQSTLGRMKPDTSLTFRMQTLADGKAQALAMPSDNLFDTGPTIATISARDAADALQRAKITNRQLTLDYSKAALSVQPKTNESASSTMNPAIRQMLLANASLKVL